MSYWCRQSHSQKLYRLNPYYWGPRSTKVISLVYVELSVILWGGLSTILAVMDLSWSLMSYFNPPPCHLIPIETCFTFGQISNRFHMKPTPTESFLHRCLFSPTPAESFCTSVYLDFLMSLVRPIEPTQQSPQVCNCGRLCECTYRLTHPLPCCWCCCLFRFL